jgi:hypothetical protein
MFDLFMARFHPGRETRVLDVGVTNDSVSPESNFFEALYPFPERIVCVGTEDGSHLMRAYPGLLYQQVCSGEALPFRNREFDIVFSNAVVEHAGSRSAQALFISELCRVGKAFFVTTPSRWFPVEHHTGLPLLHYLPAPVFRRMIRGTRYGFWALESNLNILTRRELRRLFPSGIDPQIHIVKLAGIPCNLVAVGTT